MEIINKSVLRKELLYPYLYIQSNITLEELNKAIEADTACCVALTSEMEWRAQYLLDLKRELLK